MAHCRVILASIVLFVATTSAFANTPAEQWFKKSVVTLTDLSEVPGMVLEPGTYVLRADDTISAERFSIELLNQDETQVLCSFIAVSDHRSRADGDDGVLTFYKGVTSGPKPIQTWYYAGDMNGYEFVYPKIRAKEFARFTDDHVMAMEAKDGPIVAITTNGTEVPIFDGQKKAVTKATATDQVTREKPQPRRKPKR